jgi:hypothetical protein
MRPKQVDAQLGRALGGPDTVLGEVLTSIHNAEGCIRNAPRSRRVRKGVSCAYRIA